VQSFLPGLLINTVPVPQFFSTDDDINKKSAVFFFLKKGEDYIRERRDEPGHISLSVCICMRQETKRTLEQKQPEPEAMLSGPILSDDYGSN
jgi:hypothetical protein